jgi:hypothetical protein
MYFIIIFFIKFSILKPIFLALWCNPSGSRTYKKKMLKIPMEAIAVRCAITCVLCPTFVNDCVISSNNSYFDLFIEIESNCLIHLIILATHLHMIEYNIKYHSAYQNLTSCITYNTSRLSFILSLTLSLPDYRCRLIYYLDVRFHIELKQY